EKKDAEFEGLRAKEADLKTRIEQTQKTIEVIREELSTTNRKLDARQNEYNLTKSLVDNLEGFPEAIKFLKKQSKWGKNAPLLSDILTCPEEYRVTIENYLEPVMNYYIVDTEAQAFEAINLLSDAAKGKAHFFILDSFQNFKPAASQIIKDAIPSTQVVEFEPKYRKLVQYILDNVYISSNHHTDLPEEGDAILITQNGKVIRRQYSISGGSVGLFEGKRIGRAKNLEKLSTEIKQLSAKLEEVKQNLADSQSDLEQLKSSSHQETLEAVRQEAKLLNEEYISVKTKKEQYYDLLSTNTSRKEDIQERIVVLQEELEEIRPLTEDGQSQLTTIEEDYKQASTELSTYNELLSEKSNTFNQENILFHQQENKAGSIAQEISFKQTTFESSKERIEKNSAELKKTDDEVKQLVSKAETNDEDLVAMYDEKESIEKGVNEAEKEYYAGRGVIDEAEKSERDIQRLRENADALLMELQNQITESKLQFNSVQERLSVEFNIKVEDLEQTAEDQSDLDEEALKERVEKHKNRLESMGPINPMAMEAFEEIKERYDFIIKEKDDLITAKESLLSTIGEIDEVAKTTFIEAFENIKANFIKVFRSLFTDEDDCDLSLSNPDDPLESSIDIIAKPKGKRPLSINQLSGGEKTLTATSLLFAIYLLKPAPFCIFDEVDAPLDDANIDKFNNIIKTFSTDSQFIIVTHNKRTMASTDIIYGITMVEQGVSRVVPVDLRELV
ncbi:MAG: chromosome segregation protein SMC, partial [Cyclobacteriaceae bacterium]